jgi:hypothetical protein
VDVLPEAAVHEPESRVLEACSSGDVQQERNLRLPPPFVGVLPAVPDGR